MTAVSFFDATDGLCHGPRRPGAIRACPIFNPRATQTMGGQLEGGVGCDERIERADDHDPGRLPAMAPAMATVVDEIETGCQPPANNPRQNMKLGSRVWLM